MGKTIEQLFEESKGQPVMYKGQKVVRIDCFPIKVGEKIKIVFESVNSKWDQAIRLKIDKELKIENEKGKSFALWKYNAPKEIIVECTKTKIGILYVYNGWDTGDGSTDSWLGNSGMIVEECENGRRYRCNDGYPDDDFDDLIFRIERINLSCPLVRNNPPIKSVLSARP